MTAELRHLRAFVAIADEGNLSRATGRLHLSQPTLSRTLAQLEASLGVVLVERSTHHCVLTTAGRRFVADARDTLRAAVDDALAAASGRQRELRLGHTWSAGAYLADIVRAWNTNDRPCALSVVRFDDRTGGLDAGVVDAAIVRGVLDRRRFSAVVLDEEQRVAVLPADHPLSHEQAVRLSDLASGHLIATRVGVTTPELWPEGARPTVSEPLGGVDDWLVAIAAGIGFGVSVASTAALHPHPDVRYVPVFDAPTVPVLLAHPRRNTHASIGLLTSVARDAVRSPDARGPAWAGA